MAFLPGWFRQHRTRRTRIPRSLCRPPSLERLEDRWLPSTFVVNNFTDTPIPNETNLRQAVAEANTTSGANTITFAASPQQPIFLTGGVLALTNMSGLQAIVGPALGVTVNGENASQIFAIGAGVSAAMSGLNDQRRQCDWQRRRCE